MATRYQIAVFDPLGLKPVLLGEETECTILSSSGELKDFLSQRSGTSQKSCIISITDASVDTASVQQRAQLNEYVLQSGSLLVPCVIFTDTSICIGPWVRRGSGACLRCFAPDGLPVTAAPLRVDELRMSDEHGSPSVSLLSPLPRVNEGSEFLSIILGDVRRILFGSLRAGFNKSVWGRTILYELLETGDITVSSWRQLKDPDCMYCSVRNRDGRPSSPLSRLSRVYHENSKLRDHYGQFDVVDSDFLEGGSLYARQAAESVPTYRHVHRLPDATNLRSRCIEEVILERRSRREFGPSELSIEDLSALLFYSTGVTRWARTKNGEKLALHAAPSGGALYPLDSYVQVRSVSGLPGGTYRYAPHEHSLIALDELPRSNDLFSYLPAANSSVASAAVILLLVGSFQRTQSKYLERGYRIVLLEAGHVAQNIHLIATARKLWSCCISGFLDDLADASLGLPVGGDSQVLYLVAVGHAASRVRSPCSEEEII